MNKKTCFICTDSDELSDAIRRYISKVLPKDEISLYVVDESSEERKIKEFWGKVIEVDKIPSVLFITFSCTEPQGSLEFVKQGLERWEVWCPTGTALLKQVLESLLKTEEENE